jgi:hypothetical protein
MNRHEWEKIGIDRLTDKWVYSIQSQEINIWIQNQPVHMWKYYDIPADYILEAPLRMVVANNYVFTDEMEAWFTLRWS